MNGRPTTTAAPPPGAGPEALAPPRGRGVRVTATGLTVEHRNGVTALDAVSLTVQPGRLTAVIGPSGAGKSTLLSALAGVAPAQRGTVGFSGADADGRAGVGFVPQEDVLHTDLALRRTLRHAAALRIAADRGSRDEAVERALRTLGLEASGDVPVRSLSGGQRKRASIASEILARPAVCFLDEPTSGLDPAAAADLVAHLGRMCADGSTVVFTTHGVEDIARSDQVVALGTGGRLLAVGTPTEVLDRFDAVTFAEVYERLRVDEPEVVVDVAAHDGPRPGESLRPAPAHRPGALRQWATLSRRSAEILTRNRLTLAILLGSPAAVIAMFGILFRPGAFAVGVTDPTAAVQVAYWLSFAGFFFGLTYGLLQVCVEVPVLRRERHAGVRTGAYVASKLTVLVPLLLVVNAAMLVVLRELDRIPELSIAASAQLYVTMALNSTAALCLGLLASALVGSAAQAARALPMLCFPAVLFGGAMVPLPVMTAPGRAIAALMPDRWAFEEIAQRLGVPALTPTGSPYAALGGSSVSTYWAVLLTFAVVIGAATCVAVAWRAAAGRNAR